uniref:Uncharacterized protein n=1 Tax=Myoviridae sp. ctsNY46 TaxID=2825192 RepID=A0A8S5U7J6_9CAUD|nr:MAG TPA: hypothetical protein [Myoviridae sp. ctsNY46]
MFRLEHRGFCCLCNSVFVRILKQFLFCPFVDILGFFTRVLSVTVKTFFFKIRKKIQNLLIK